MLVSPFSAGHHTSIVIHIVKTAVFLEVTPCSMLDTNISKEHDVSIFRTEVNAELGGRTQQPR